MPLARMLAPHIFFVVLKTVETEEECVHVWFPRKRISHPCIDKTHHSELRNTDVLGNDFQNVSLSASKSQREKGSKL